jgi:membrane-bound transcription factor site-1 protease
VALLASTVPEATRWSVLNPASMKQALIEGAARLRGRGLYEQGAGRVDMIAAKGILDDYSPRASLFPAKLNFTDCPYMWPHCEQPLYAFRMPLAFNATVLNGLGASGRFARAPRFEAANEAGQLLEVSFTHAEVLWPWSGWLGIFVEVGRTAGAPRGGAAGGIFHHPCAVSAGRGDGWAFSCRVWGRGLPATWAGASAREATDL